MQRKIILAVIMAVFMSINGGAVVEAYSGNVTIQRTGVPVEDTWVLNYNGTNVYVEAGSLNIHDRIRDIFSAVIIFEAKGDRVDAYCEFVRTPDGDTDMLYEGAVFPNKDFVYQLYDAIRNQFDSYF